jgi:hypothetical protein
VPLIPKRMIDTWTIYQRWVFAGVGLLGVALLYLWVGWVDNNPPISPNNTFTTAQPAYLHPKTSKINVKSVEAYNKKEVVKKLKLPPLIANNTTVQITATADIPPNKGDTLVVSVLNTKTGHSDIVYKPLPREFFRFEDEGELKVRYEYSARDGVKVEAEVATKMFGMGPVSIGPYIKATQILNTHQTDLEGGVQATATLW